MRRLLIAIAAIFCLINLTRAQCAIRRNLPVTEKIPLVWNGTQSTTFQLPRITKAIYSTLQFSHLPIVNGSYQIDRNSVLPRATTELEFRWDCVPYSSNPSNKTLELQPPWHVHPENTSFLIVEEVDSPISISCRVRPRFSALYRHVHTDWKVASQLLDSQNFTLYYNGTEFDWHPCTSENAYSDNIVTVYPPVRKVVAEKAVATVQDTAYQNVLANAKLVQWARLRSPVQNKIAISSSNQEILDDNAVSLQPCEDVAQLDLGDMDALKSLVERKYINYKSSNNFTVTRVEWQKAPTQAIAVAGAVTTSALTAHHDECNTYWGSKILIAYDDTQNKLIKFGFYVTATPPVIDNPFVGNNLIPTNTQCIQTPFFDILDRLNRPSYRSQVTARHGCVPRSFPTEYRWRLLTGQNTNAVGKNGECVHMGQYVHEWVARACGQTTTSFVTTYVADLTPPQITTTNPKLSKINGVTTYRSCYWPSLATDKFCPADDIRSRLLPLIRDNCFGADNIIFEFDWAKAQWSYCSQTAGCVPQPQLNGPEAANLCFEERHLQNAENNALGAALRLSVQVRVVDPCGNRSSDPISVEIAFINPGKVQYDSIRARLCPSGY